MKKYLASILLVTTTHALADCQNLSEATQTEISSCTAKALDKTKKSLNGAYNQLYSSITAKRELEAAQKAWVNYRNRQCELEDAIDNSVTMATIINMQTCELRLNNERIEQITDLIP